MNTTEEELTKTREELNSMNTLSEEQTARIKLSDEQNATLANELTTQREKEKEQIEILNIDLEAAKSVSETQKTELEYLKAELEKGRRIIHTFLL